MAAGRLPTSSVPSKRMLPPCGRYTPLRQLKIDVFPAPFGPMTAKSSPAPDGEAHIAERGDSTERKGDVTNVEKGAVARHRCPSCTPPTPPAVRLEVTKGTSPAVTDAQVRLADVVIAQEVGRESFAHDVAVLEHRRPVGDRERHHRVLLDEEHARPALR